MGAGLVVLALRQEDISHGARCVLACMAVTALDADDPPTYWRGWGYLAKWGLGYPEYDRAAVRAVTRYVRELLDVKLIEQTKRGVPGQRAEYTLHLRTY